MFMVFFYSEHEEEFRGEGETLSDAYTNLESVWGEELPTDNLRWFRVEPIKVKVETSFFEE